MSVRAVVVQPDGTIARTVTTDPTMLALNVGDGEALFQLTDDAGGVIDDAHMRVDETGSFTWKDEPPPDRFLPPATLQYVAL